MLICDSVICVFSSELHLGLLHFHCNNVIILPVAENVGCSALNFFIWLLMLYKEQLGKSQSYLTQKIQ